MSEQVPQDSGHYDLDKIRLKFRELMEVHGNRIMLWASAILLLIAALVYYQRTTQATNAEGWAALFGAESAEDLAGLADSFEGTPVGDLAKIKVAEQYLQTGMQLLFTDREASKTELKEAETAFTEVLNRSVQIPLERERALFGLARTQESLSDGDFTEAIKTYEKLLEESPESPYKSTVEERLELLKNNKQTSEFYAWFAAQNPKAKDRETPTDLLNKLNLDSKIPPASSSEGQPMTSSEGGSSDMLSVPSAPAFPPTPGTPAGTSATPTAPEMPVLPPTGSSTAPPATTSEPKAETPKPATTTAPPAGTSE